MLVARVLAPPVVDHDLVPHRGLVEQPGEQLRAAPVGGGHVPLAVAEDDRRLVARDQVLELRDHVLADVLRPVGEVQRVVPLVERVVVAHLEVLAAHGLGQVAEQVPPGADFHRVPRAAPGGRGLAAWPQREPLVVLGRQDHVLRAGALENVRPVIGVEQLRAKPRGEVAVEEVGPVHLLVVGPRAGFDGACAVLLALRHGVPVPLRIGQLAGEHRCVGRHGVDTPVDEDPELGLGVPSRRRPAVDGLPRGLILLRRQRHEPRGTAGECDGDRFPHGASIHDTGDPRLQEAVRVIP